MRVAQLLGDQLEPGGVRHLGCLRGVRLRRRRAPRRSARRARPRPLLGADRVVAPAPALVGVALDHPLELVEAVNQRLGPRRAARDVDVDRHELVRALDDRVVGEHAAGRRAGAHRDRPPRLEHLVVDPADDRRHLDRDPAREDEQVGLARRGPERLGAEAGAGRCAAVDQRRSSRSRSRRARRSAGTSRSRRAQSSDLLERRRQHRLLGVLGRGRRRRCRRAACRGRAAGGSANARRPGSSAGEGRASRASPPIECALAPHVDQARPAAGRRTRAAPRARRLSAAFRITPTG